ncbi:chromate transporter [Anaerosolibacter sp.]|uniref:chromate transporter n=1 Tax=Anaerosolibacter sp. TaxID=1872527 RepID=UPI0039F049DF
MKSKKNIYRKLFSTTFCLSAFTFGGGFVIIPLMQKKFVEDLHWIEKEEMLNLVAIAQSSPGAVAVNASILLGYHLAGVFGAMISILGTVLPPLLILSIVSFFYASFSGNIIVNAVLKGMQIGVAAVVTDAVLRLGEDLVHEKDVISILVMFGAFIATFFMKVNVMYIILVCGCIGVLKVVIHDKKFIRVAKPNDTFKAILEFLSNRNI